MSSRRYLVLILHFAVYAYKCQRKGNAILLLLLLPYLCGRHRTTEERNKHRAIETEAIGIPSLVVVDGGSLGGKERVVGREETGVGAICWWDRKERIGSLSRRGRGGETLCTTNCFLSQRRQSESRCLA